jgi:hypothetical protein
MNLKTISINIGLLLFCSLAMAQQVVDNLCMQVIGSNGLSAEKLGRHYDATLGEAMTATMSTASGDYTITQGFHQPECALGAVNVTELATSWQLELFPNPTSATLNIRYQHPNDNTLDVRLWSITGVLLRDWQQLPSGAAVDCSLLASGIYLFEFRDSVTGQQTIARFVKTSI